VSSFAVERRDAAICRESSWTPDMSERNSQLGRADGEEIAVPALTGMRYLARTSPPIPDAAMQEAHWLIEANTENTRH
jgi:hypothetical protein